MNTIIRKISIGRGYPDGIHYKLGSEIRLNRVRYEVTGIHLDRDLLELGKLGYNVYIKKVPEYQDEPVAEVLWKTIIDQTVVIENNIDFD